MGHAREIGISLKEYCHDLGKLGWWLLIGGIGGAAGYAAVSGWMTMLPGCLSWVFLVCTFAIVPFIGYHRIRQERDRLQAALDNRERAQSCLADALDRASKLVRFELPHRNLGPNEIATYRDQWFADLGLFYAEAERSIIENIGKSTWQRIFAVLETPVSGVSFFFNGEHKREVRLLVARAKHMQTIFDEYARHVPDHS